MIFKVILQANKWRAFLPS